MDTPIVERKKCYESRDHFFECFDRNNGDESRCIADRRRFDSDCPASWVCFILFIIAVIFYSFLGGTFYSQAQDRNIQEEI